MTTDRHFRELRLRLVDCARSLRYYRDNYEGVKAQAEQHAIDSGKATGKNAEERTRSLTLALQADDSYNGALGLLRDAEYEHERCAQLLEAAKDERRAAEWQIRAKLADGLFRANVQSDSDDPIGDSAFDDVTDRQIEDDLYVKTVNTQRHSYRPKEWELDDLPF